MSLHFITEGAASRHRAQLGYVQVTDALLLHFHLLCLPFDSNTVQISYLCYCFCCHYLLPFHENSGSRVGRALEV